MFHFKLVIMKWIKVINKFGSIVDHYVTDEFYNFICNSLHYQDIFVFGEKFYLFMFDEYTKSLSKDYSVNIDNIPSIISC